MSDPSLELQATLVTTLKNNSAVQAIVGNRVYDEVPNEPIFPYISLGDNQVLPDDAECIDGTEIFWQIDGWAREPRYPVVKAISKAVTNALHNTNLNINNYQIIVNELNRIDYLHDPDGITRHVALSFRFLIQAL